jgi:predicted acetyltransferase
MKNISLVVPAAEHLASYRAALERGWSPDNVRGEAAAREQLEAMHHDPVQFIRSLDDPEASGPPITLPDGTSVPRLPRVTRWIWDQEFCGSIGFRWQRGTSALPPHVLGHIGFAVVPWKRRLGYATQALSSMLREVRQHGLHYIELTTTLENESSQRVISANGGEFVEQFTKLPTYGGGEALRFRITL